MPPKRKNPKKPPNLAEILKTVQTLNGNKEDIGSTTAKDIEEFLCKKVTVAKFVYADPSLVKNLIEDAVAQSKIFPISVNNSIEYRTWKTIGDDRSNVVHFRGDIPGPSYFQLLKNAYNLTRPNVGNKSDKKGITSQEWLDWFQKDSRFLNYDLEIFNDKLIPLGIKRGHILEVNQATESQSDDQNEKIRPGYIITDQFLSYYKLFRRNRILALQALVNADNGESNESLFAKNVTETSTMDMDDSDIENDNENSIDAETSAINHDSSQSTVATNDDMELKKDLDNVTADSKPNASTVRKEPPTASPTVASNQPQRVSQRKRFKKTLGPDFVESDTVMMYESSNHSRTRYSQSSSNQSSASLSSVNQSASQTLSSNSKSYSNSPPKPLSAAAKSAPSASTSASSVLQPNEETKPTSDIVSTEPTAPSQDSSAIYGRWLPSVELCFICKQPYKRCKRYSYIISCQECGSKAHGTCFRTFIGNQPATYWICSECRPDCVCQICKVIERKPDFYLVCQKCSTPYHAHCWREKGHAACQICKFRLAKVNIPSSSSSSLASKPDPVQSESSPKIMSPKVTATTISTLNMNNSKIMASKSNSLLQSSVGESSGGGTVCSASVSGPAPSNCTSIQLNGKSLIGKPQLTTKVLGPKIVTNQTESDISGTTIPNTVTVDAVKIFKNDNPVENQIASQTPTISETNDDHPSLNETIKVEEPTITETIKLSKSTSSKMNPKILDPLLKHNKTEQINSQNCNNTSLINNPNSRKSITMDPSSMFGRRPAQAICYNFQTWLESELKPNRPYDDLTPLTSLPNAITEWTSEEVHRFITTIGHPNEADRFLEKEIDGLSVLLLTREDLLNALSLKIGPALKLLGYLNRLHEEMQQ